MCMETIDYNELGAWFIVCIMPLYLCLPVRIYIDQCQRIHVAARHDPQLLIALNVVAT